MFNTQDFTKMFDPQAYAQNMQKWCDLSNAVSASKQGTEVMKKVSTMLADTFSTCTEKQFKYAQSAVEDCIEAVRDLSAAKGVEDYMAKQAEFSKKFSEKAQTVAQDIASQWQKTQTQCTSLISQNLAQGADWAKSMTNSSK
jgi:phasin family protein